MESLIFRGRPDERNECDQWTPVKESDDPEEFVVQEHVRLDAVRSGKPYLRLVRRMTIREFLSTDQPQAVKLKLQAILDARKAPKGR
jgi:hypothetical protein